MTAYTVSRVVQDSASTYLRGLSDIDLRLVNGNWILVAASETDGAITTWRYSHDSALTFQDHQTYSTGSGTHVVSDLSFAEIGTATALIPATRYEDSAQLYEVRTSGDLSDPTSPTGGISGFGQSASIQIGGNTFVYAGLSNTSGLNAYQISASLQMTELQSLSDTFNMHLRDISALETVTIDGAHFLFATSAFDSGLDVFAIEDDGTVTYQSSVNNGDGTGFYRPADMVTLEVHGQTYMVMASSGSSTLTAYAVDGSGELTETDQVWDSGDTRFYQATSLASFEYQNRGFVVAAGSDDGFTVLEIQRDGQFNEILTIEDSYTIALQDVSGLDVEVFGATAVVFASSWGDDGFTQVNIDLTTLPPEFEPPPPSINLIEGTDGVDDITGTAGDDLIVGKAGHDTLNGADGDDVIDGGAGEDRLRGNDGRDTFVFTADGQTDVILDFNINFDLIDLSGFSGVNYFDQLLFGYHGDDIGIITSGEVILLDNASEQNLQINQLTEDLFIF